MANELLYENRTAKLQSLQSFLPFLSPGDSSARCCPFDSFRADHAPYHSRGSHAETDPCTRLSPSGVGVCCA